MKHEALNIPSTHNVLRMMFECKTFDVQNREKGVRRFETKVKLKSSKAQTVSFQKEPLKTISI